MSLRLLKSKNIILETMTKHCGRYRGVAGASQMVIVTLLKQYKESEDMEFIRKTPE